MKMKINMLVLIALVLCFGSVHSVSACDYYYSDLEVTSELFYKKGIFKNSLVTGTVCRFTNNVEIRFDVDAGRMKSETPYVDGKANGIGLTYHDGGELKSETPYVDGKIDGIRKTYFKDGELSQRIPYVNGLRHGAMNGYYSNGDLFIRIDYDNGSALGGVCYKEREPIDSLEMARKYLHGERQYKRIDLTNAQLKNWEKGLGVRCN